MEFEKYISVLNSELRIIKGVGEKKSALFAKMGIKNIWDLIHCFPRKYEDRRQFFDIADAPCGQNCCIKAVVVRRPVVKNIKKNVSLYIIKISDGTGYMDIKWFSSPFNKNKIVSGAEYVFYGYVSRGSYKEMDLKAFEPIGTNCDTGRIIPQYPLTAGLSQNDFKKAVSGALAMFDCFIDSLPEDIISANALMNKNDAIREMHNPQNPNSLKKARMSLAFEELFTLTLALKKIRLAADLTTEVKITNVKCAAEFAADLPYELTADQKKVINEICRDLLKGKPMNRILQGDVGSGKTVVAAAAAYIMRVNGYQTAIMAPTEILANQHYDSMLNFFGNTDIKIGLLTGSTHSKKSVLSDIANGNFDIVIGTHALIDPKVKFKRLGMCITDEQHRFGVNQRAELAKNEKRPHVLVMSATPIPRTLALAVYGDLDLSVIKTMPKNRQAVETYHISPDKRSRLNHFISKEVQNGHQCFVVCPLIDESDNTDVKSSVQVYQYLKKVFPMYCVGLIHGKMNNNDKDAIMRDFHDNRIQILISTTVVEVGIDVPNATVMVVENAERFGLSQLHQLRGRVGRGNSKSYCILVSDCTTDESRSRMSVMCSVSDGFEVAQKDLEMRGCGEFFGTRQHGLPELKIANLFTDAELIEKVAAVCDEILKDDPQLLSDELVYIKGRIKKLFSDYGSIEIFN